MSFTSYDKTNLLKRGVTGVFGIFLILGMMIYGGRLGVTLLALAGCFGSLFEYFVMVFSSKEQKLQQMVGIGVGFCVSALIIFHSGFLYEGVSVFFIFLFVFYLSLSQIYEGNHHRLLTDLSHSLVGIFYVSFLFSFWPKIRELPLGVYWIFLVFLIPWLSDTAAYFMGKSFGKHKLSEAISPHKTIEGAVGGILAALLGVALYKILLFKELTWLDCLLLGIIGSVFSQVGDLFESFLKRAFNVKDSGIIIPGHGGILDRFDGVLFCGPFLYFYARFL